MKKFNFTQNGGVPLTNDLLDSIQQAYSIYSMALGFVGNFTILQGCEDNGNQINPGIVFINNEVYYFEGGLKNTRVYISEEKTFEDFEDNVNRHLISDFKVKLGNSVNAFDWADFVRIEKLKDLQVKVNAKADQTALDTLTTTVNNLSQGLADLFRIKAAFTTGGAMVFFRKPANLIPAGWAEVVDWRERIAIGHNPNYVYDPLIHAENYDLDQLGKTGGEFSHKLTIPEMPVHRVNYRIRTPYGGNLGGFDGGNEQFKDETWTSDPVGGDKVHNNMPPYKVVMYIEYVGI